MLQSLKHFNGLLFDSFHVSFAARRPELDTVLHVWPHQCQKKRKDPLCQLTGNSLPNAGRRLLALVTTRAGCWLTVSWCVRTTRSSSAKLLFSWSFLSLGWCLWLFLPRCWDVRFPLMNFMMFLLTHSFSLLYYGSTAVQCFSHCYQFCLGFKFAMSCSLMNALFLSYWTQRWYWRALLASGCQLVFIPLAQQFSQFSVHLTVLFSSLCFIRFKKGL